MIPTNAKEQIRDQVLLLSKASGGDSAAIGDDEVLPTTGRLDSASIMALILWYEDEFGVSTDDEELTLDNFGTVNRMVDYLSRHVRG